MIRELVLAEPPWYRLARKMLVAVIGSSVLGCGVALIVLPGPAILVIPLGLAILAREFVWARLLLQRLRTLLGRLRAHTRRKILPSRESGGSHEVESRD
jgi:tellurite resistance protein TerC